MDQKKKKKKQQGSNNLLNQQTGQASPYPGQYDEPLLLYQFYLSLTLVLPFSR